MNKVPGLFVIAAYLMFAGQAVIFELKLARFSPGAALVVLYLATIPLAIGTFIALKVTTGVVVWPSGNEFVWALVAGLVYFTGDYLLLRGYAEAYNAGGISYINALVLTAIVFPFFGMGIKYIVARTTPNVYYLGGLALTPVVLFLAYKGLQYDAAKAAVAAAQAPPPANTTP